MIVALYIICSTFALLVIAGKLREARRELRQVTWQRDAYAQAIQAAPCRDDYALPAGRPDRRPEE